MRCHKLKKIINDGLVTLTKIHIEDNGADTFTKSVILEEFRHCLGFIKVPHC